MSGESRRVALRVSYDGTNYSGWQRQENADGTCQAQVEKAQRALTGETIGVTGASRTDAGVHALGQTVHFDNPSDLPRGKILLCAEYAPAGRYPRDGFVRRYRRIFARAFRRRGKLIAI